MAPAKNKSIKQDIVLPCFYGTSSTKACTDMVHVLGFLGGFFHDKSWSNEMNSS